MDDSVFSVESAEDSSGFLLWQTTTTWQRKVKKALEVHNIAHGQFVILANLLWFEKTKQESTQGLIVQFSKLDKMTVSKALKKLSAERFLKRTENLNDTRAKSVHLTKKGRALASILVPIVEEIDKEFFDILTQKEQKNLNKLLVKLVKNNE